MALRIIIFLLGHFDKAHVSARWSWSVRRGHVGWRALVSSRMAHFCFFCFNEGLAINALFARVAVVPQGKAMLSAYIRLKLLGAIPIIYL